MRGNRPDGSLPERELHDIQQKNGAKPTTRSNPLLRQARKKRTWSQEDLAECIGVSKETVSRWENGVCRPQPQLLHRLCETFQTTPEALGYALEEEDISLPKNPPHFQPGDIPTADSLASSSINRHVLSRRRIIVAGGIALGSLATLIWFKSQLAPSPRHWPSVAYDLHHRAALARVVQWMLQARQYDLGSTGVDGIFGPVTQFAVKTFQKDHHLPEDGIVSSPTWELLIMPSDPESRGSQVSALQERLQAFHLVPTLVVDGEVGPQTIEALRRFRQKNHLQVKDAADRDTWCLLVGGTLSR